ncbi:MAG: L,D-transpeptidase [Hyphomicrobium sp.]
MRCVTTRIALLMLSLATLAGGPARAGEAVAYLEGLKGKSQPYLAPSEIDPRFTIALYVNVATQGPNKQRMWVLHRDAVGGPWRLAMWDGDYWKKQKLAAGTEPPFSWPVSTGRVYRGDRKSGPTPTGIFGMDERRWRYSEGRVRAGMIHVMHIDHHTPDGRVTGVAFHGTTVGNYRRLGTNDSHGCIRMHQSNALALLDRLTGRDGALSEDIRWGEVPRFWASEEGRIRRGFTTDGKLRPASLADATTAANAASDAGSASDSVLTKTGFRAIAVLFQD